MGLTCRHCHLYNRARGVCDVQVISAGQAYELPVRPEDECHWERVDRETEAALRAAAATAPHPKMRQQLLAEADAPLQILGARVWSDGKNGHVESDLP